LPLSKGYGMFTRGIAGDYPITPHAMHRSAAHPISAQNTMPCPSPQIRRPGGIVRNTFVSEHYFGS